MTDDRDDNRTIADMSGVERPRLLFPRRRSRDTRDGNPVMDTEGPDYSGTEGPAGAVGKTDSDPQTSYKNSSDTMPKDERRAYIFGAMGAGLIIGLIFLGAAALVILLMIIAWT